MDFLLFRLYGPLASWGDIAVGESRHSATHPSKSALLGLIGAALGITREDASQQNALSTGYHFAVKVLSTGQILRDYHTTQVPDAAGKKVYRTRREELVQGRSRLGTILSTREYRCDAVALIAVKALPEAPFSLEEIGQALRKPKFHLYLGRKSCPVALPLRPTIMQGKGFGLVLDNYKWGNTIGEIETEKQVNAARETVRYYWEGDAGDMHSQQLLIRYDQPLSRTRWQFSQRTENLRLGRGG